MYSYHRIASVTCLRQLSRRTKAPVWLGQMPLALPAAAAGLCE